MIDFDRSGDIKSKTLIWVKGFLFLALGIFALVLILLRDPSWQLLLLQLICIWAFCRAYYFAFYVIEKYVDAQYKYSGLIDFLKYTFIAKRDG